MRVQVLKGGPKLNTGNNKLRLGILLHVPNLSKHYYFNFDCFQTDQWKRDRPRAALYFIFHTDIKIKWNSIGNSKDIKIFSILRKGYRERRSKMLIKNIKRNRIQSGRSFHFYF